MPIISSNRADLLGFARFKDKECQIITKTLLHLFVSNHNIEGWRGWIRVPTFPTSKQQHTPEAGWKRKGKSEEKPKASSSKPGSESIRHQEEDLRAPCLLALLHDGMNGMAIPDFEQRRTILGIGHTVVKTRLNSYISMRAYVWMCREEEKRGAE